MSHTPASHQSAPTFTITVAGTEFAYRTYGAPSGTPLVLLTHLGANLDGGDPQILDGLAQEFQVIAIDYRGVGRSTGTPRSSMDEMAADMIGVIRALGHDRIDLLGLSMGGMVAQALVTQQPDLVERLILVSAGPAGGPELTRMTGVMIRGILRAPFYATDPTALLFFSRTRTGKQAAHDYLARLKKRTADRDRAVSPRAYRSQLAAVKRWGSQSASTFTTPVPVLILHGDSDRMVPPANASALKKLLPAASVITFPDSGHGVIFQNHRAFVDAARTFLRR